MLAALPGLSDDVRAAAWPALRRRLCAVPGPQVRQGMTERSVWSLFEPAHGVQKALLGSERFWDPGNTWRVALVRLALAGVLDRRRLTDAAAAAADDERMGRNHRSWYRSIPQLLTDPHHLPHEAGHGPPPPGNQLRRPT